MTCQGRSYDTWAASQDDSPLHFFVLFLQHVPSQTSSLQLHASVCAVTGGRVWPLSLTTRLPICCWSCGLSKTKCGLMLNVEDGIINGCDKLPGSSVANDGHDATGLRGSISLPTSWAQGSLARQRGSSGTREGCCKPRSS
jgi:hypothetical protein